MPWSLITQLNTYSGAIEAATAVVLPLGSVAIWFIRSRYRKPRRSHVYVRAIDCKKDKGFLDFLALYTSLFPEGERVATKEIQCWLDGKAGEQNLDYNLLVAYCGEDPVGFVIVIRCRIRNWLYVPFIGISAPPVANHESISREVYAAFFNRIVTKYPKMGMLVMEFSKPDDSTLDPDSLRRRKSRIKLFSSVFHLLSLDFGCLNIDYQQPSYCTDLDDCQKTAMALYIASRAPLERRMSRSHVMEIVDDLYARVYLHCVPLDSENYKRMKSDLKAMLGAAKKHWPKAVEIVKIG